jgi:hypothetical protein
LDLRDSFLSRQHADFAILEGDLAFKGFTDQDTHGSCLTLRTCPFFALFSSRVFTLCLHCGLHFEKRDWTRTQDRLNSNAVPG